MKTLAFALKRPFVLEKTRSNRAKYDSGPLKPWTSSATDDFGGSGGSGGSGLEAIPILIIIAIVLALIFGRKKD